LLSRSTRFPSLQKFATVGVGSTLLKSPEQPTWSDIARMGCLVFTRLLREIDKLPGRLVNTYLLNQSKQGPIPTWHTRSPASCSRISGGMINATTMQCLYAGEIFTFVGAVTYRFVALRILFPVLLWLAYLPYSQASDSYCLPGS
jgi:hypothetical protein